MLSPNLRGRSRNQPKCGRVIPFNFTPLLLLLTIFVSSYSRRAQKPLQGALSAVFCAKLCLIHRVRLDLFDEIK